MGNMGINSIATESMYQNWQFGKTECLAGVSWEGLTCEILARHNCLHLVLTLRIPACASHMSHFIGCLVARYPQKLFSLQLLESSHSLSITQPLQSNPTINTRYKRLNRIIIKFGMKLKPTKHIVVNHNFTIYIWCMLFFTYLSMCCFFSLFIHMFLYVCNLYFYFTLRCLDEFCLSVSERQVVKVYHAMNSLLATVFKSLY